MEDEAQVTTDEIGEKVQRGKAIIRELAVILKELPDSSVGELLGTGLADDLLKAILDPFTVKDYPSYAEFFFQNKWRSTILAGIRHAITINYSFKGKKDGKEAFVSPDFHQWFEDGIICLEGKERFMGFITLYRNKELTVAIANRDIGSGEDVGPNNLRFIKIDEIKKYIKTIRPEQISDLERPIRELKNLISKDEGDESKYQELLMNYPWAFGAEYLTIQRHEYLDDENIPDFTGVKVRDGARDIFELKPPTMKVFAKNANFTSDFHKAWDQAERYLDFVHRNEDYLRKEKGRIFDNPKCYLILGWNLSEEELKKIRIKERGNPSLRLLTYNDLIAFMDSTINLLKGIIPPPPVS
jgi:hypothetical protein